MGHVSFQGCKLSTQKSRVKRSSNIAAMAQSLIAPAGKAQEASWKLSLMVGKQKYCWWFRNPTPPGIYQTLEIIGYLPYQLVSPISSINSSNGIFPFWIAIYGEKPRNHQLPLPKTNIFAIWGRLFQRRTVSLPEKVYDWWVMQKQPHEAVAEVSRIGNV